MVGSRQQQDELFATVARQQIIWALQAVLQGAGDLMQAGVADLVAKAVVERLKVIDVQQGQAQAGALTAGACQRFGQGLVEMPTVRDTGQLISNRAGG
jgi:hypothetical protein